MEWVVENGNKISGFSFVICEMSIRQSSGSLPWMTRSMGLMIDPLEINLRVIRLWMIFKAIGRMCRKKKKGVSADISREREASTKNGDVDKGFELTLTFPRTALYQLFIFCNLFLH